MTEDPVCTCGIEQPEPRYHAGNCPVTEAWVRSRVAESSKQKSLDSSVADRLAELADGSNFGSLEELQEQLLGWSMDLRSGASSILDYAPDETNAWRCFHCGEVFTDREAAADHFGVQIDGTADDVACKINATDGLLVKMLREAQHDLRQFHQEDNASFREFYVLGASHSAAMRLAEEQGYARGLEDAKKHPETLGLMLAEKTTERREPPYRVRAFWSPCRKHLVTACCSTDDITLVDDNGNIWEPTGPEQDVADPKNFPKEPDEPRRTENGFGEHS